MAEPNELELLILRDLQEWVETNLLDGESWDEHFNNLKPKQYTKRLDEVMEIYWKDHIFPIDQYIGGWAGR